MSDIAEKERPGRGSLRLAESSWSWIVPDLPHPDSNHPSITSIDFTIEPSSIPQYTSNEYINIESGKGVDGSEGSRGRRFRKPKSKFKLWRRRLFALSLINFLINYRRYVVTTLNIILPSFVMLVFILTISYHFHWELTGKDKIILTKAAQESKYLGGIDTTVLRRYFCKNKFICQKYGVTGYGNAWIYFTPINSFTQTIMDKVYKHLGIYNIGGGVPTEFELIHHCKTIFSLREPGTSEPSPIGIIFSLDGNINSTHVYEDYFKHTVSYRIRTYIPEIANTKELFPYRNLDREEDLSPYITTGFLGLQNAIDFAYMELIVDKNVKINSRDAVEQSDIFMQTLKKWKYDLFPYTFYLDIKAKYSTWFLLVFSIVLGTFFPTFMDAKRLIEEKESGILELLTLHGMTMHINWTAMILQHVFTRIIQTGLLTWILTSSLTYPAFLKYENPMFLWLLLYLHGFSHTTFVYCFANLFSKAEIGATMAVCMGFITSIIPMTLYVNGINLGRVFNSLLCLLFPNWSLANALYNYLKFESYDTGGTWFVLSNYADDRRVITPIAISLLFFPISGLVYFGLLVYLDNVLKKKLLPSQTFCYCIKRKGKEIMVEEADVLAFTKPSIYEEVSKRVAVECRKITHVYNGFISALDDISMDIYQGEVTVFLGNTGSGKTTLIQCIGGLIQPTAGYSRLKKLPFSASVDLVRQHIGYTPQHHLFYQHLTVQEHIHLCCMLHGHEYTITKRQCVALLIRFHLYTVKNRSAMSLSEAQKRKLSIAMAMANNPSVLILDQPTTGMDSSELHDIWTLIRGLRKSRAIIVTANTIDEGDLYGDRIGMMAKGKLLSFCNPGYLKLHLNAGCFIKLRKQEIGDVNVRGVIDTIEKVVEKSDFRVAQAHMKAFEHYAAELYFSIPPKAQLSRVLGALENKQDSLGFLKAGVMHYTLAGILNDLTMGAGVEEDDIGVLVSQNPSSPYQNIKLPVEIPTFPAGLHKSPNYLSILIALFIKQYLYIKQKQKIFWFETLFPIFTAFFLVYFSEIYIWEQPTERSLILSASTYPIPVIPVYINQITQWERAKIYISACLSIVGNHGDRLILFGDEPNETNAFEEMLKPSKNSLIDYRAQVVMGMSLEPSFTAYYASNALHSAPAAHNFLTNVFLFFITDLQKQGKSPLRLLAYNHPIPQHDGQPTGTGADATNAVIGIIFSLILAFAVGLKITLPIVGRLSGNQDVLICAGVTPLQYWLVFLTCDASTNVLYSVLLMGAICIGDMTSKETFQGVGIKATLFYIMLAFLCWSALPFVYILSKYVNNQFTSYGQYIIIHIIVGVIPQMIIYIIFYDMSYMTRLVVETVFSFFPPYTVTGALVRFVKLLVERSYCTFMPLETQEMCGIYNSLPRNKYFDLITSDPYFSSCCNKYCSEAGTCYKQPPFLTTSIWEIPINLTTCLYIMFIQGIFYMVVLLILEYTFLQQFFTLFQSKFLGDVDAAKLHLLREFGANTTLELSMKKEIEDIEDTIDGVTVESVNYFYARNITKWFGKREVLSHVYFGIPQASVLGIMGLQNSGKSVLTSIIAGNTRSSAGYCVIRPGIQFESSRAEYLEKIGYCPQSDAVLPFLTGFQMMQLVGRIRGLPADYLDVHCRKWLDLFGLTEREMNIVTRMYDSGMKRRLCCAIALLGNCEILVFDEPTQDLDVLNHLNFWSIIQLVRLNGQSIIFTSLNAQECIEYSTKVLLLENGKVKAVGSPTTVSDQYATGWTLFLRFRTDITSKFTKEDIQLKMKKVKDYVNDNFSPCELKDEHDKLLIYHVKLKVKPLSEMYKSMENLHKQMPHFVNDYLIEESSLDDILGYFGGPENYSMRLPSLSSSSSNSLSDEDNILAMSVEELNKWEGIGKHRETLRNSTELNTANLTIAKRKRELSNLSDSGKQPSPNSSSGYIHHSVQPKSAKKKIDPNQTIINFLQNRSVSIAEK